MSAPIVAFFNNKGGVGKTSLAYHVAWMFAERGTRVVAADLDPQANLTAAFLDDERVLDLWSHGRTIFGALRPLLEGTGDVAPAHVEAIDYGLGLIPGDLALSGFEDELSTQWPNSLDGKVRAFRVLSAFWRAIDSAVRERDAQIALVDVGPNLGAINRAALLAADYVVIPLAPDLFSIQGLQNLGPTLRDWRAGWKRRLERAPDIDVALPAGSMEPLGYVVLQHSVRLDRPVYAYERWIRRIPSVYREAVLDTADGQDVTVADDPYCIALIKHYRSLIPMAQEARKPIFALKPADGAIGAHAKNVQEAYRNFTQLVEAIEQRLTERAPAA